MEDNLNYAFAFMGMSSSICIESLGEAIRRGFFVVYRDGPKMRAPAEE